MDPREEIRSRLDFKAVVERYVPLKPAGKGRWKGLCPFHNEKTPSFYVDEQKGMFYCFGCKAGGDAFKFVQMIEGVGFREALEKLAQETGVELPERGPAHRASKDLIEVNRLALSYFRNHLEGPPLAYLKRRGLDDATIERYALGFAPKRWDGLVNFLKRHDVPLKLGLEAGVLAEKDGRVYDRLRARVVFPIRDPMGRVVAFTGRALADEDTPKYLNTPESDVFKKNRLLYGYPEARKSIRERKRAIVVEGLFDVLALAQMGWTETVAVLGSALSPEQAQLLERAEAERLYLAFDADEAGRRATLAGLDVGVARRFLTFAVLLPEGRDPGDLLTEAGGKAAFARALDDALPEVEFRFAAAAEGVDLNTAEGKRRVLEQLLPRLTDAEPFDPVAEALKAVIVDRLGLDPRALEDLVQSQRRRRRPVVERAQVEAATQDPGDRLLLLELDVIAQLLAVDPDQLADWVRYVEDHTWPSDDAFLAEFIRVAEEEGYKPRRILDRFAGRGEGGRLFERLMLSGSEHPAEHKEHLDKSLARLREGYLRRKRARLTAALKEDPEHALEILKEIQELDHAIEAERRLYRANNGGG
ncbi:DNA primase [Oceanithermus desulfurans]|uniref:DNA primase n=2 Tax=Oceanithermus desulfurans TaxID=227924 RepID=A0A511RJ15_9DEIN|nr:DNA primase [Oceanithermus desulfurans]MBB6029666.1 DNA primase [Oceanithermus desulfurans]GEM89638.1 DNA primase [Oceanithermus desulfurans NBRC 100063]